MWTPKTYRSNTKPQEVFAWMAIGIIEPHPPKKKKRCPPKIQEIQEVSEKDP